MRRFPGTLLLQACPSSRLGEAVSRCGPQARRSETEPPEPSGYLETAPPVTSRRRRQWWGTNSRSLSYMT